MGIAECERPCLKDQVGPISGHLGNVGSNAMASLQQRLERGDVILLDGGTGTELQRRGVPMHSVAWSAAAMATHPEIVRAIHEDYLRAGAEI